MAAGSNDFRKPLPWDTPVKPVYRLAFAGLLSAMEALPKALEEENRLNLLQNLARCTCGCMSNQLMQGCPGNRNVENTFVAHVRVHASRR